MKDVYQYPSIAALADALAPVTRPWADRTGAIRVIIAAAGRGRGTGPDLASHPLRSAAALDLPRVLLPRGLRHGPGFRVDLRRIGSDRHLPPGGIVRRRAFVSICTLPIVAKWVLIGRWKPQEIRIWSIGYVRFWTVKTMIRANPMAVFVGSPLYSLYLRLLGARIGRGVVILSKHVPVCTDLLTIGSGTVIRKEAFFQGYRAHAGRIQTGAVTLGRDVYIGEKTVLDINTAMGDGAQLGHASTLHSGVTVPAGERWHGSPARARRSTT